MNDQFKRFESNGYSVGRVALEHKRMYRVYTDKGEILAEISGKMRFEALNREDYPAVGDWVVLSIREEEGKATIHGILPRFSKFSRKVAGLATEEQIIATNINTVFLVNALNQDFNIRRIERYLLLAWESGANPVIVLTKSDLCTEIDKKVFEVESVAYGVPIHVCSVKENTGIEQLGMYFDNDQTVALLGSSGVGKSSLTNCLLGEEKLLVNEVREDDDRGRHTTTHRELLLLESGGVIIDTPGMRELQLWESDNSLSHSFQDIEELTGNCRFRDCSHETEPECAIRAAIENGTLDSARYQSYLKLQRELAFLERKTNIRAQNAEKEKWKKITSNIKKKKKLF
ncbi:ribosome small subunit-dependent GTPase A [Fredinandcohnia sp. SECRCQ15]|uniref:Small ribosomal subunit biogenesis GTPase RsgA n=1 Tax=Fredinandcohnia quinoae TaxID=2918902 RepID=A0AAW5EBZ0_9BACI|nr:ribosome small subunit-dependent GTPase A [Fredinandcohnia sp. SECRCQ15]MCH1626289.1 ribosome small subunit-dependent GTPase A [Fredinandcohnia sp. SECRCQ15]